MRPSIYRPHYLYASCEWGVAAACPRETQPGGYTLTYVTPPIYQKP